MRSFIDGLFFIVIGVFVCSGIANAGCRFNNLESGNLQQSVHVSIPLQISNITPGNDLPNGTILYQQLYKPSFAFAAVVCDELSSEGFVRDNVISTTPYPLSNWSGNPYGGHVYETGLPGVGAVLTTDSPSDVLPGSYVIGEACAGSDNCSLDGRFFQFRLFLIKIGQIGGSGSYTLNGNSLPCVDLNFSPGGGSTFNIVGACFEGIINVIAKTCKTPDVDVTMGSYDVAEFSGEGSSTEWKDASLHLTDCPAFFGINNSNDNYWSENNSSGVMPGIKNSLLLKLTPTTEVLNSAEGIIDVQRSDTSAKGVGVQLAYGVGANLDLVDFGVDKKYEMESSATGDVTLPLSARYIQTEKTVQAGQANSAVTYIINYQ